MLFTIRKNKLCAIKFAHDRKIIESFEFGEISKLTKFIVKNRYVWMFSMRDVKNNVKWSKFISDSTRLSYVFDDLKGK